jgi:hypothetical protein
VETGKSDKKVLVVGGPVVQKLDPVLRLVPTGGGQLASSIADAFETRFTTVERIINFPTNRDESNITFSQLQDKLETLDADVVVFMPHLPNILIEERADKIRYNNGVEGVISVVPAPKLVEQIKSQHPETLLIPFKLADKDMALGDIIRWMLKLHSALAVYSRLGDSKKYWIVDVLGNETAVDKADLPQALAEAVARHTTAVRRRTKWQGEDMPQVPHVDKLVAFSRRMKPAFENTVKNVNIGRWPGNFSFRCTYGFLSRRGQDGFAVTIRDISKESLTEQDFVYVAQELAEGQLQYWGRKDTKPSIDSPVHRVVYERLPWVQSIVHGHVFVEPNEFVCEQPIGHWPCGAENEAWELAEAAPAERQSLWIANITGHGFIALIGDENPETALNLITKMKFRK